MCLSLPPPPHPQSPPLNSARVRECTWAPELIKAIHDKKETLPALVLLPLFLPAPGFGPLHPRAPHVFAVPLANFPPESFASPDESEWAERRIAIELSRGAKGKEASRMGRPSDDRARRHCALEAGKMAGSGPLPVPFVYVGVCAQS